MRRKKSIASCFAIGALLCTLTSSGIPVYAASANALTVAEAGKASLTEVQDIRNASEQNIREIVKAAIKSTEQGDQQEPLGTAIVRIAGASVKSGAADYETAAARSEQSVQTAVQSESQPETAVESAAQVQEQEQPETAESTIAPELEGKVITTVDTYLNIRQEPAQDSEVVGRLYEGSAGTVLETADGWTKISSGDVEGWVHNDYVVSGADAQSYAEQTLKQVAVVQEDGIRVRAGASIDSTWVGVVNSGESYVIVPEETAEPESSEAAPAETESQTAEETETAAETAVVTEAETQAVSTEAAETESTQAAAETAESQSEPTEAETEAEPLNWVKIEYEDGEEGYVCADYVTAEFSLGAAKSMEAIRAEEQAAAEKAAAEKAAAEKKASQKTSAASSSSSETSGAAAAGESGWVSLGEFKITAYCGGACCNGKWAGTTASGAVPSEGRTIAVAPWIIPYGTQVKIAGMDGVFVAEDTGGFANKNPYQIDLFVADHGSAGSWGVRYREVWVKR